MLKSCVTPELAVVLDKKNLAVLNGLPASRGLEPFKRLHTFQEMRKAKTLEKNYCNVVSFASSTNNKMMQ